MSRVPPGELLQDRIKRFTALSGHSRKWLKSQFGMLSLTSPAVRARLLPARGDTARRLSTTARPRLSKHRSAAFVCAAAGTQNNASDACAAWKNVKAQRPLVQCITNFVSMDLLANTLLAAGASPAMVRFHAVNYAHTVTYQ